MTVEIGFEGDVMHATRGKDDNSSLSTMASPFSKAWFEAALEIGAWRKQLPDLTLTRNDINAFYNRVARELNAHSSAITADCKFVKAVKLAKDGHVKRVRFAVPAEDVRNTADVFVRADVLASMRQVHYRAYIALKTSGEVSGAHCAQQVGLVFLILCSSFDSLLRLAYSRPAFHISSAVCLVTIQSINYRRMNSIENHNTKPRGSHIIIVRVKDQQTNWR